MFQFVRNYHLDWMLRFIGIDMKSFDTQNVNITQDEISIKLDDIQNQMSEITT
jgi:hypothetical protein